MDTAKQFSLADKERPRFTTTLRRERIEPTVQINEDGGATIFNGQYRGPTQAQVNSDVYDLESDLRPRDIVLHLANAGLIAPRPVLMTYKGRNTNYRFRQEVVL